MKSYKFTLIFLSGLLLMLFIYSFSHVDEEPFFLGFDQLSYFDETRDREVTALIWYPANQCAKESQKVGPWKRSPVFPQATLESDGKHPLILISHGYKGKGGDFSWLAEAFVQEGYIVLSVNHVDNKEQDNLSTMLSDRPLDISFMLTAILDSPYSAYIDRNQVGFLGYSLGGLTGIWLAGGVANLFDKGHYYPTKEFVDSPYRFRYLEHLQLKETFEMHKGSFRDPRIKAVYLIAPSWGWIFERKGLEKIRVPVEIIAPEKDEVVITETNARRFAKLIPNARFFCFRGGVGHFTFLNEIDPEKISSYDPDGKKAFLYTDTPGVDRAYVHQKTATLALQFFHSHLHPGIR